MKEARTLLPPWGERNFSRIVWRGRRRRSPGSVSSKPISTNCIGSDWGERVGWGAGAGVEERGAAAGVVEASGAGCVAGVVTGGVAVGLGAGIVVIGVMDFGGDVARGVEGGGMRVTGVVIGGRMRFGRGIGLRLPLGGGIRVTGVANRRCAAGACGLLFGTGGIGADCSACGFGVAL